MAMTLRLDDAEAELLRRAAEREGVSMQTFARRAVVEAATQRTRRRDELIAQIGADRRDLLDRLGQ
ncbi:DUF6290 family protein [Nocardioides rubriscoriae]|uniref:DUF6290 family protein n=1 Tax=Nocardioides rubriscoriae TaxID=642762 RepID=UPI0011E01CED|nr:DUF6290 family protein [Nocardioides rubriscoriae]